MAIILEWTAVAFGVAYIILAAYNKIACWSMGIVNSILSIILFVVYAQLYGEAVLYSFYVIAGIYGWYNWKKQKEPEAVFQQKLSTHLIVLIAGTAASIAFYFGMVNLFPDAQRPLIDSFTTIFSFIATYMTTRKWIENWIYWVIIDAVSTYLYFSRGLELYAALMLVYSFIAVYGFLQWRKLKIVHA